MATRTIGRLPALRKVKYGASDMMVTELCAGTMTWGSYNGDESEAHAQLDYFVSQGVNFFDTAELPGRRRGKTRPLRTSSTRVT